MNPIMIKPPKNANHELSAFTARADPVKAVGDDVAVTVTARVLPPGRTQVHVWAGAQLVGPCVPIHVVVWPVQVSIGHVVRVSSTTVVPPAGLIAFKHCPLVNADR
jgi:hypothetical protein